MKRRRRDRRALRCTRVRSAAGQRFPYFLLPESFLNRSNYQLRPHPCHASTQMIRPQSRGQNFIFYFVPIADNFTSPKTQKIHMNTLDKSVAKLTKKRMSVARMFSRIASRKRARVFVRRSLDHYPANLMLLLLPQQRKNPTFLAREIL